MIRHTLALARIAGAVGIRRLLPIAPVLLALVAPPATADCGAGGCIPGGGTPTTDCWAEFSGTGLQLNWPVSLPGKPAKVRKQLRCFDGDAGCDADGTTNGACAFNVDLCLANVDPSLPACTPAPITSVTVRGGSLAGTAELEAAALALSTGTAAACTSGQIITVPLRTTRRGPREGKGTVKVRATTASGAKDRDTLRLRCLPRQWPSHGFNHANQRATPHDTGIGPADVANLAVKWDFDIQALEGAGTHAVTSTPTLGNGLLYVTSWNGRLYALRPADGQVAWSYHTQSGGAGLQSSATLTADGRVVIGDSAATIHCLEARTGTLLWKRTIGGAIDHVWASPAVANGRVIIGLASHSDVPCTRGRLVALDLDSGDLLWERFTVPERVCRNDTAVECTTDAECGGEPCEIGRGAGITATVAIDPTGETIYANTVGCYTYPSIGDSDSIMRLDAATGADDWITRVQPPEQFGFCSVDPSIDCGSAAHCPSGTCTTKSFYHDFGFLNGPLLVEADDGAGGTRSLVVSGSKDGTLYALDPLTGSPVWAHAVRPTPVSPGFAGFGLFNGAVGFAEQRFHAALYNMIPSIMPPPPHLAAFSALDGAPLWDDEIGLSWGDVALANGVVYVGTQAAMEFYAYNAATGTRLRTFPMAANVAGGAAIVDRTVYVPYGVGSARGGVLALSLP